MAKFAAMKKFLQKYTVWFTLLFIAVCSAILDYYLPAMGDDLGFWRTLGLENYTCPDKSTILFIGRHILACNGRIFDYMGPVVINLLPRAGAAAVMGAMMGLYFYSLVLSLKVPKQGGHLAFTLGILAVAVVAMPWWDSMWLRVCQFNYAWATTFCLLFIYLFFRQEGSTRGNATASASVENQGPTAAGHPSGWMLCLLFILGVCAGGTHEQTGVAMSGAFILWGLWRKQYKRLSHKQITMSAGLFFGTLLPLVTPAFWRRLGSETISDDPIHLIETTFPIFVVLVIILVCLTISYRGRQYLRRAIDNENAILIMAATAAAAIGMWSGVPGRTGWFVESASLVVLGRMALAANFTTNKVVATPAGCLAILFIVVHYTMTIPSQLRAFDEYMQVKELYAASSDGVIYYDYTPRYDFPFMTLNRVKGVPDADDGWLRQMIAEAYGSKEQPLVVVPTAFRGHLPLTVDSLTIGNTTAYRNYPPAVEIMRDSVPLQQWHGIQRVVEPLPEGWLATELVIDPGDYH